MLVGRERQLRVLENQIDGLMTGRGGLVLLVGDAGIGKTHLAEEGMRRAVTAGADAHRTTCWAEAGAPPFWPWSQLLRSLDAAELDIAAGSADPEFARFRLFSTVGDVLRQVGAVRPRFLVLDDLHWADASSVRLLGFLAPLLRDTPVLVLATYRESEAGGPSDLATVLPELIRHGRQIAIPPLGRDEIGAFVAALMAEPVPDDLINRLYRLTEGNPLFMREVVSLLEAQDALSAIPPAELPVPESVRSTLMRRLDCVGVECRRVLGVGSVVGVEFGVGLVSVAMCMDESRLLKLLDEADAARLVRASASGRFMFTHPLIRETAYLDLGLAQRTRLHRDIAEGLEELAQRGVTVDPAELAYHFRLGSAGGDAAKALLYAAAAGRRAMEVTAYEAAVAHYEYALEVLTESQERDARRCELLLDLGEARVAAGQLPSAREAFDDAAELALHARRPDLLARAALGPGSGAGGFEVPPFDAAQIELLRHALAELGTSDAATRSRLLARLAVALQIEGSEDERLALSEEAVALAREAEDPRALAHALAAHCDAIPGPDHCEQRLAEAGEIVTLARAGGDVRGELLGRRLRVMAFAELGRFDHMDAEIDAFARVAATIRQPLYAWYVPLWRGMRALMEGRFAEAIAGHEEARALGQLAHSQNAEMLTLTLRICWLYSAGFYAEAYQDYAEVGHRFPGVAFMAHPGMAMLAARIGQIEQARGLLRDLRLDDGSLYGAEWLCALVTAAEALACIGDDSRIEQVYATLLPYRELYALDGIAAGCYGSVANALGMLAAVLGRAEDAQTHFAAALLAHQAARAPALVEQTRLAMARFLGDEARVLTRTGSFRREGDVWALTYEGRTVRLRHTKGIADLARLVERAGTEMHVLDLVADGPRAPATDTGPRIDATARDAYKARLLELENEIADADEAADAGRSELLHAEREHLLGELAGAYGLGGRARRSGDPAERARSAVTQRVRDALTRIEREHAELGGHLRRAVRTGTFCVYEPDGPVEWEIASQR